MSTCQVCPMVGCHGHDKNQQPILVGSRVRAHNATAVVEVLNQFNASVRYDGDGRLQLVSYSLLETIDVEDQRPAAVAAGKLQDALMLVKEATEVLPVSPEWDKQRVQLQVVSSRLHNVQWDIEHMEPQS
jgi:hypothetical protein